MATNTTEDLGLAVRAALRMMSATTRRANTVRFDDAFAGRVRDVADAILDGARQLGLVVRGIRTGRDGAVQLGIARGGHYRGVQVGVGEGRRFSVEFVVGPACW